MTMEYGKAFTFPQADPEWVKKWAIAGVIALIPVIGQVLLTGYAVAISRRVIRDETPTLPDWSDAADIAIKGVITLVIRLAYVLPFVLVGLCAAVPMVGIAIAQNSGADTRTLNQAASLIGACLGCVGVVYGFLAAMLVEAAVGRYAATGQLSEAFRLGEVWRMVRAQPGMYLIVVLVSVLGMALLTVLGVIACVIGAFWGAAYGALAAGHLNGQAYRRATGAPATAS